MNPLHTAWKGDQADKAAAAAPFDSVSLAEAIDIGISNAVSQAEAQPWGSVMRWYWQGTAKALADLRGGVFHKMAAARRQRALQQAQAGSEAAGAALAVGLKTLTGAEQHQCFTAQGVEAACDVLAHRQADAVEQLKNGEGAGFQLNQKKAPRVGGAHDGALHDDPSSQKDIAP